MQYFVGWNVSSDSVPKQLLSKVATKRLSFHCLLHLMYFRLPLGKFKIRACCGHNPWQRDPQASVKGMPMLLAGQTLDRQKLKGKGRSQYPLETVHKECVFDIEQGGMVEVGNKDEDWLNGREAMPHERRLSFSRSGSLPASLSQVCCKYHLQQAWTFLNFLHQYSRTQSL